MVLGGEWAVGSSTQPRIHADMGRTPHSKLLHVQSPNWEAGGVPSTKDNGDLDQHSGQPEDMPSFWVAQKSPIDNRRGSQQEGNTANDGSIPRKEMDTTGAPAGPPHGHTISKRPGGSSGLSASSMASITRHARQSTMSRERMSMLRFTLNKCKYIELTIHTGLQGWK